MPPPQAGADAGAASQLDRDTGVRWVVSTGSGFAPTTQVFPHAPPPPLLIAGAAPVDAARAFLTSYGRALFGLTDPSTELTPLPIRPVDRLGLQWVSLQQVVQGVPVAGRTIVFIFDGQGRIALVSSGYVAAARGMSVTPAVTAAAAQQAAQADMTAANGSVAAQVTTTPPMLAVLVDDKAARLAWETYATADGSAGSPDPFLYAVDAQTGAILFSSETTESAGPFTGPGADVGANGLGAYKDDKSFLVYQSATTPPLNYLQQDVPGATSTEWVEYLPSVRPSTQAVEMISLTPNTTSLNWSPQQSVAPGSDVDAFVYINHVALWWWRNYGWSSWDGLGAPIQITMYPPPPASSAVNPLDYLVDNAGWFGSLQSFRIGWPSNPAWPSAAAAADVMGHEYTHAVNSGSFCVGVHSCASAGMGIPVPRMTPITSAMNESLSDSFGQLFELDEQPTGYPFTPAFDGEGTGSGQGRNLEDPHQTTFTRCQQPDGTFGQPDNMFDPFFTAPPPTSYPPNTTEVGTPCADPHYFAGVPNNAWYLATFGGTNGTSQVTIARSDSLGAETSAEIYSSLMLGGTMGTALGFHDLATFLVWVTRADTLVADPTAAARAVACSWYAVGVFTPDELFQNFDVGECQCPTDVPDGTLCGGHRIWQSTPGSLYTCAGGKLISIDSCRNQGTGNCLVNDPPGTDACEKKDAGSDGSDAGSADGGLGGGCLVAAKEVGSALRLTGATGPSIQDLLNDGLGDLERSCTYTAGASTVTLQYDLLDPFGKGQSQTVYNMLEATLPTLGYSETPVALGQSAFAAVGATSPDPVEMAVLVNDATLVVLTAPFATLSDQTSLLQLIVRRL